MTVLAESPGIPANAAKPRVVLLDAVGPAASSLKQMLANAGYDLLTCLSGEEVLQRVAREGADLILLPEVLPEGGNPVELIRTLRGRQRASQYQPILIQVRMDSTEAKSLALTMGADDYIQEPLSRYDMLNRIGSYLRLKKLHDELAEANAKLLREREAAARLQIRLLPSNLPEVPGVRFAAHYAPTPQPSGDFYDLIPMTEGGVALAIGDILGRGVRATLSAAVARAVLRSALRRGDSPAEVLAELNRVFAESLDADEFMTLYIGVLDPSAGMLIQSTAGHPAPWSFNPAEPQPKELALEGGGPPLGVMPDATYSDTLTQLPKGCRLLLMTNGVFSSRSADGLEYGLDRVTSLFGMTGPMGLREALDVLVADLGSHLTGSTLRDDVTLLLAEWTGLTPG